MRSIRIHGASEHNLKGISLEIPRETLTVFTGVSGSGKSSLAFDTIYREGQRRFLESLPAYARRFLGGIEKPKVDAIEGLSPTISVDQKTVGRSPRSTVGTVTEIYDYLRLLWARAGEAHCPACGRMVAGQSPEEIWERILARHSGRKALVCAPVVREKRGEHRALLRDLRAAGHWRVLVDGEEVSLREGIPSLQPRERHTIEVVWDRLEAAATARSRWIEAIEKCLEKAAGVVSIVLRGAERELFSSRFACPSCGVDLPDLEPGLFSFNSPRGACPDCAGLGEVYEVDPELVVLDPKLPLGRGGLALFASLAGARAKSFRRELQALGERHRFTLDASWAELDDRARRAILRGDGRFPGLEALLSGPAGERRSHRAERWMKAMPCASCGGARLRPEARAVLVAGKGIHEVCRLPVSEALSWVAKLQASGAGGAVLQAVRGEILGRLRYLEEVGLSYLTLDRKISTLAGGEAQRLRLASQLGTALRGVIFVLDEPSIGLHARDQAKLIGTLCALRDLGNTVLVVEHDRATIEAADHLVDLGPGAGPLGGEVVAQGKLGEVTASERSLTGDYLSWRKEIPVPPARRRPNGKWLEVLGARENNLKGIDVRIPVGLLVAVTGVSGSGKSSLVDGVIRPALLSRLGIPCGKVAPCTSLRGHEHFEKLVEIDQAPIGKSPRSNPATYAKIFDLVRELFAKTPEARARGYTLGRFSFNKDEGRCPECEGAGVAVVEMQFLPSVEVTCDACAGKRYNRETLEIRYRGKNVSDVLEMTAAEACEFFRDHPQLRRTLELFLKVGLGYLKLGQPSTMLSGGEAQRVKLAAELRRKESGRTFYVFDEPTTGLHFEDVKLLLEVLSELVERGNTVVVVEHNLDVIKAADWVIDLGPEGGEEGGRLVAEGPPEEIAKVPASHTGRALRPVLARARKAALPAAPVRGASPERFPESRDIRISGASEHNLKDVDATVPHGSLTVVTGVSGSGKTSLVFDTVFAEAQRRYLESLSTYARAFLGRLPAPRVRKIEGLSPAIAIDQRSSGWNPRSTVATMTEIYDYLRLLFARAGTPHCPACGERLERTSPTRLAAELIASSSGRRAVIYAPAELADWPWGAKKARAMLERAERLCGELLKSGFVRIAVAGEEIRLDEDRSGAARKIASRLERALAEREAKSSPDGSPGPRRLERGDLMVVVDRIVLSPEAQTRISASVEQAFKLASGVVAVAIESGEPRFATRWPSCPREHFSFREELEPSMFSFASQRGACPGCSGSGVERTPDVEAIIRNPERPLPAAFDPAFLQFLSSYRPSALAALGKLCEHLGIREGTPFSSIHEEDRSAILWGLPERFAARIGDFSAELSWPGLIPQVRAWAQEQVWSTLPALESLLRPSVCSSCGGDRLRGESLAVRIGGKNIAQVCKLSVSQARSFFHSLELPARERKVAERVLSEIENRLRFLAEVGLGYLGLDRTASTLSGGEAHRIRLASQLGNRLSGVLYALDEPTVGLHQRDVRRLLDSLRGLRDLSNTVVVVEHDRETLLAADWVIDVGPGPGSRGGRIVVSGTPEEISRHPSSLTGRYLRESAAPRPRRRRSPELGWIELGGVSRHNLRGIDVNFPLGLLVAVTGVSGSGKSTLVMEVLVEATRAYLDSGVASGESYRAARGLEALRRLAVVDQQPIGRTPRSNAATYTGLWDHVRQFFAQIPLSRVRGWGPDRFSFNTGEGRCPHCAGQGARLIEMYFLSDVWVPCEACSGKRFRSETLEVRYKGKSIGDVLEMEVDEAFTFFEEHGGIRSILASLRAVGLGYLKLGQSADTLSGGEAQRLKLATELVSRQGGGTLYVLDEPTTGLHHEDVAALLEVLGKLVDAKNTVVVIEHQLDVVLAADWVIDLGPEAADEGGRVVAAGPPEAIAACPQSHTGRALRRIGLIPPPAASPKTSLPPLGTSEGSGEPAPPLP